MPQCILLDTMANLCPSVFFTHRQINAPVYQVRHRQTNAPAMYQVRHKQINAPVYLLDTGKLGPRAFVSG